VDLCNTIADINGQIERRFRVKAETYPVYGIPRNFFSLPGGLAMFHKATPYFYSAEVLRNITRAGSEIIYVTTRPEKAADVTEKWIKKHGFPHGKIIFTSRERKADYIINTDISYVFEDDPLILSTLMQQTTIRRLFVKQWPYNRGLANEKIIKFCSWHELMYWSSDRAGIKPLYEMNRYREDGSATTKGECNGF